MIRRLVVSILLLAPALSSLGAHAASPQRPAEGSTLYLPLAYQAGRAAPTPVPTSPAGLGRIIYVPADEATIEEGLDAAKSGDTVLVDPGAYTVAPLSLPPGVTLSGSGMGTTRVTVEGGPTSWAAINAAKDSVVRDLSVAPLRPSTITTGIWIRGSAVLIDAVEISGMTKALAMDANLGGLPVKINGCILHENGSGIAVPATSLLVATRNTLADNETGVAIGPSRRHAADRIARHSSALQGQTGSPIVLTDNIIAGSKTIAGGGHASCVDGASGATVELKRNVFWDCGEMTPGPTNAYADPLFNDREHADYTPSVGSPLAALGLKGSGALPAAAGDGPAPAPLAAQRTALADGKQTWRLGWRDDGHSGYSLYIGRQPGRYDQRIDLAKITHGLPPLGVDQTLYVAVSNTDPATDALRSEGKAGPGAPSRRESVLSEEVRLGPGLPSGPDAPVIRVPDDFPTIGEAMAAAEDGDTVWVGPGTYPQATALELKAGVRLIGAGWPLTILQGGGSGSVVRAADRSHIEGFTIQGGGLTEPFDAGILVANGPATITRNRITANHHGLYAYCLPEFTPAGCHLKATITWNLIDHNTGSGIDGSTTSELDIRHNTLDKNGVKNDWDARGIALANPLSQAMDNVVGHSYTDGLHNPAGAATGHNLLWRNGLDLSIRTKPDSTTYYEDPQWRQPDAADYRMGALSAAIGRASDGISDIGAVPFLPGLRTPTNLQVTPMDTKWRVSWSAVDGAAGYRLYLAIDGDAFNSPFKPGAATSYELSNLPGDVTYGVVVGAYDAAGDESLVSRPVTFTVPPTPDFSAGDNGDPVLLVGDWRRVEDPKAMDGAYLASSTPGDRLRFTFAGDRVVIYRRIGTDGAAATIKIDGTSYGQIAFNFNELRYQVPTVFENLGRGTHTLTLEVGSPIGTGKLVAVDELKVPDRFSPSPSQQTALEHSNAYRARMKLPPFRLDTALNLAAQAHAEYATMNPGEAHGETPGRSGFIGRDLGRFGYFGYTQGGSFEVMHFTGNPYDAIDGWMSTVYHRLPFAEWTIQDAGYGISVNAKGGVDVMDFGTRPVHARRPAERHLSTYPVDGERGIPPGWSGGEGPDPLPGKSKPVGYPISLHITRPAKKAGGLLGGERLRGAVDADLGHPGSWLGALALAAPALPQGPAGKLTSAELFDSRGAKVPVHLLDRVNDPNKFMGDDDVFIVPKQPMESGATYTAHFVGTDSGDEAYDVRWSFTTGSGGR